MENQFDPKAYLNELLHALELQYEDDPEWVDWNKNRLYFLIPLLGPNPRKRPDACFLSALCAIARKDPSQAKLLNTVMPRFIDDFNEDLRNIRTEEDCEHLGLYPKLVPFQWFKKLSENLSEELSFSQLLQQNINLSGLELRNLLIGKIGVKAPPIKRISLFIRDFYSDKHTFPIDSNVKDMLNRIWLPVDEDLLVRRCELANFDPAFLERLLYIHGKNSCQKNRCTTCSIDAYCRDYQFRL